MSLVPSKTFIIGQVIHLALQGLRSGLKIAKITISDQGPQNTNEINLTVMNCDMDITSQTLTDFLA